MIKSMDTGSRPNQTQWGTATGDPFGTEVWAQDRGTANWNITSNEMCCNSASNFNVFILGSQTSGSQEILVRVNPADTTNNHGIVARYNSSTQYYYIVLVGGSLVIGVAPSFSTIASVSFSYSAGSFYWLRARLLNNNLYAKAWASGSAEPTTWSTSGTDSTYSSGGYGLGSDVLGVTNTQFDGFVVTDATISVVADTTTPSESITLTGAASLSESVQLAELVTSTGESDTIDTVSTTETVTQAGACAITDTTTLSESLTLTGTALLTDAASVSETVALAGASSTTDVVSPAETLIMSGSASLTENVQVDESITQAGGVSLSDMVSLAENITLIGIALITELAQVGESVTCRGQIMATDLIQLSDAIIQIGAITLSDNVALAENVTGTGIDLLPIESVQLSENAQASAGSVIPIFVHFNAPIPGTNFNLTIP